MVNFYICLEKNRIKLLFCSFFVQYTINTFCVNIEHTDGALQAVMSLGWTDGSPMRTIF